MIRNVIVITNHHAATVNWATGDHNFCFFVIIIAIDGNIIIALFIIADVIGGVSYWQEKFWMAYQYQPCSLAKRFASKFLWYLTLHWHTHYGLQYKFSIRRINRIIFTRLACFNTSYTSTVPISCSESIEMTKWSWFDFEQSQKTHWWGRRWDNDWRW